MWSVYYPYSSVLLFTVAQWWKDNRYNLQFYLNLCVSPPLAFCPYHIGHFSVVGLGFEDYVSALRCLRGNLNSFILLTYIWVCHSLIQFLWYHIWFQIKASHFDGLVTTILGYILLAGALMVCHVSSSLIKLPHGYEVLQLCFYCLTLFFVFNST